MNIFYYFVNCKLSQNFFSYKYKSVLEREREREREREIDNASDIKIIKYIFQYNYHTTAQRYLKFKINIFNLCYKSDRFLYEKTELYVTNG